MAYGLGRTPKETPAVEEKTEEKLSAPAPYYCEKCKRTHLPGSKIYQKHLSVP